MTWKGIMHPLPQRSWGNPSIFLKGPQWRPSGAKRRPCKGTCGTKRCLGNPCNAISLKKHDIYSCLQLIQPLLAKWRSPTNQYIDIYSYHISDISILHFDALICFCQNVLKGHQTHTSPPWWSATSWSLPTCSIKNSSRWNERERHKSAVQHLAESSPSASKLPLFFAQRRLKRNYEPREEMLGKSIGWIRVQIFSGNFFPFFRGIFFHFRLLVVVVVFFVLFWWFFGGGGGGADAGAGGAAGGGCFLVLFWWWRLLFGAVLVVVVVVVVVACPNLRKCSTKKVLRNGLLRCILYTCPNLW